MHSKEPIRGATAERLACFGRRAYRGHVFKDIIELDDVPAG
jgi:hypothetical protein